MDKIRKKFKEDPVFAVATILVSIGVGSMVLRSVARTVEATALAYHAIRS